jgi:hypothetical protein
MIENIKVNLAAIIVGILAALPALVLVGIATAAEALLSLIQGVYAPARTASKPPRRTTTEVHSADTEVVKMPEGRRGGEDSRSAA